MRLRSLFLLVVTALLGGVGFLFLAPSRRGPPDVLIITIDTMRADAAGRDHETPAIADFLAEATHFRNARTVVPLTLPAHVSLFSGLFPSTHGVHDNVSEPMPAGADERGFSLLAEDFQAAGYATAAFVSRPVLAAQTGLDAGFERYDCPPATSRHDTGYVAAEERVAAAIDWLGDTSSPSFTWVHLFDPHAPFHPYPGDARRSATAAGDPDPELYAGEVRRADAAIEQLLDEVDDETIVVLVSDHGEGLQEHGETSHGPLCYGSTIDIFLAMRGPGVLANSEDAGLRSICDVAPTLRQICNLPGAPEPDIALGSDRVVERPVGRTLLGPPHAVLVSESLYTFRIHGWGQVFAATDGRYTLIESGSRLEFFDRQVDRGETLVLPFRGEAYERLDRAMERYRSTGEGGADGGAPLLASLPPYGQLRRRASRYLGRRENGRLLDPRKHLRTWAAIEQMRQTIILGKRQDEPQILYEAVTVLRNLARVTPDSPRLRHCTAFALGAVAELTGQKRYFAEAAREEGRAIELGFAGEEPQLTAIRYAVGSGEAAALQAVVKVIAAVPAVPATVPAAIDAGVAALGVEPDAELIEALRRIRRRAAQASRASKS